MCCKNGMCKSCQCVPSLIAKVLVIIGGINWGLVGVGMLLGRGGDLNVVNIILGSMPALEAVVYVLVGIAAIVSIFGCKCKKCASGGTCDSCSVDAVEKKEEVQM